MIRITVIAAITATTPSHCRGAPRGGRILECSGGVVVTALSPRLLRGCQGTAAGRRVVKRDFIISGIIRRICGMDGMAASSSEQIRTLARGIGLRQVRLVSGIVLFTYLVSHFLNHALGNVSLEAMADGVRWHTAFWQFLPVSIVFYGACLVHAGLGLWALYERRQFRWKAMELWQLALGLSIPVLVIAHVLGVRLALTLHDHHILYPPVLFAYFVSFPAWRLWGMIIAILAA